jgi:hypothetical protein
MEKAGTESAERYIKQENIRDLYDCPPPKMREEVKEEA